VTSGQGDWAEECSPQIVCPKCGEGSIDQPHLNGCVEAMVREAEERGRQAEQDEAFGTLVHICNEHLKWIPFKECGLCQARRDAFREALEHIVPGLGLHRGSCPKFVIDHRDWLQTKVKE
jgi:hypothetical protein